MIVYVHTAAIVTTEFTNISVKYKLACFYYFNYLFLLLILLFLLQCYLLIFLEDRIVLNDNRELPIIHFQYKDKFVRDLNYSDLLQLSSLISVFKQ